MAIIDVARIVSVVSVTRILAVIRPVMVKAESKSYMHSSPFPQRESSGVISEPRCRLLAALRTDAQLKKGRSPPCPLRPLGSGGTNSALRSVTRWSSVSVGPRAIDRHVCCLRAKLGAIGRYIETIPTGGYRLVLR
jgi:hypothetical protein